MSYTTISYRFKVGGILVDPTSIVFSDAATTYGVKRTDTDAVVVAAGTALTKQSTGVYSYTFEDPADGLTYEYVIKIVYGGMTLYYEGDKTGGSDSAGTGLSSIYTALLPRITPYVNGCPDDIIKQTLRQAARDFFTETEVWQEDLATIASEEDEDTYDLESPYDNVYIVRVRDVTIDTVQTTFDEVAPGCTSVTLSYPMSSDDSDIVVSVTFAPDESCVNYPTIYLSRYGDGIAAQTLFLLKSMSHAPWFDPQMLARYERKYIDSLCAARREVFSKRGPGIVTVAQRDFV